MKQIRIALFGATGYTGYELIRLIQQHPSFQLVHVAAHSQAGKRLGDVLPGIAAPYADMVFSDASSELPVAVDLAFTALPHVAAANTVHALRAQGVRVVDLSADYRHADADVYQQAYAHPHPYPEDLPQAVYGLHEYIQADLAQADLVANPGCYPTCSLLPLLPLLQAQAIDPESIVIDAKSGASGAGRSAKQGLLYCELNEGLSAYGLPRHRHAWEIEEGCQRFADVSLDVQFTPHILPMSRGMMCTIHVQSEQPECLHHLLQQRYQSSMFVQLLAAGRLPSSRQVCGSNRCDIGVVATSKRHAVIVACIDNLLKGASGQAMQNANVMFGLPEQTGLSVSAVWP